MVGTMRETIGCSNLLYDEGDVDFLNVFLAKVVAADCPSKSRTQKVGRNAQGS